MTVSARIDFADPQDPAAARLRHAFAAPRRVLVAHALAEVRPVLDAVEAAARGGAWALGYVRYEAAPAFDVALVAHAPDGPLAWFAVHDGPLITEQMFDGEAPASIDWQALPERAAFDAALAQIQEAIAAGRYYQLNHTAIARGQLNGSAAALFAALRRAQPGGYAAFIDDGLGTQALSVSPELFFDWRSAPDGRGAILTRPMKGTAPRGATSAQDAQRATALHESPKERAENVMIVDLLRNDLSRIAEHHSVRVPRLFHVEPLPAVWQMTSDVTARTRAGTRLADVFGALFPCGSVTGAPKVAAMRAIHALEDAPRGVYCGAIGVVRPGGDGRIEATFNVPIRTAQLRAQGDGTQELRCGVGSGIVSGADASAEWNEWRAKRAFIDRASQPFELLETLGLFDGVLRHRAEHLDRLRRAADHFGYPCDMGRIEDALAALVSSHPQGAWRVRLLLDARGTPRVEALPLTATASPVRLALASGPFPDADSEFTRHKTTRRAHYARFAPVPGNGVFDTILYNEAGEITETTFGSLALQMDGQWFTPALACGLLPGVGRQVALREGRMREAVVRLQDLPRVQGWAFINSLRGWLDAELAPFG